MKDKSTNAGMGRLPAQAPLANPYVPFQVENPPMYDARKGFIRGTIYPGLDLPFMGKVNNREKAITPMNQLQTMAFTIQELALYLDTHPNDAQALELYRSFQRMYHDAQMHYAKECGPMNHKTPRSGPYCWLKGPWPWEYCANKEG